jgi:hypothetical protein
METRADLGSDKEGKTGEKRRFARFFRGNRMKYLLAMPQAL